MIPKNEADAVAIAAKLLADVTAEHTAATQRIAQLRAERAGSPAAPSAPLDVVRRVLSGTSESSQAESARLAQRAEELRCAMATARDELARREMLLGRAVFANGRPELQRLRAISLEAAERLAGALAAEDAVVGELIAAGAELEPRMSLGRCELSALDLRELVGNRRRDLEHERSAATPVAGAAKRVKLLTDSRVGGVLYRAGSVVDAPASEAAVLMLDRQAERTTLPLQTQPAAAAPRGQTVFE